jgi:hypothetical protein
MFLIVTKQDLILFLFMLDILDIILILSSNLVFVVIKYLCIILTREDIVQIC